MPFVTLIIPIYNAERYLRRCLDSVVEQTYADMEVRMEVLLSAGNTRKRISVSGRLIRKIRVYRIQEIRQCCWPEELICSFWTVMTG